MFFSNSQMVFLTFLITGTVIAVSSNSWFTSWVGLEINLMSFMPIILSELNSKSTESTIKYFLAQAMASIFIIFSASTQAFQNYFYLLDNFNPIIFLSLSIKAGMAPFHYWFPQVMEAMSWMKCLLILSWQKIAPFTLMACFTSNKVIYILIIFSSLVGAAGGLNQIFAKMILTYSSIAHSSWMILVTSVSIKLWMFYFLIYTCSIIPIIFFFNLSNTKTITEIYISKTSLATKLSMAFLILSLAGLPPFMGFSAKLIVLYMVMNLYPMMIFLILISSSLVSLFFYLKLFFNTLVNINFSFKNFLELKNYNFWVILITLGNLLMSSMILLT